MKQTEEMFTVVCIDVHILQGGKVHLCCEPTDGQRLPHLYGWLPMNEYCIRLAGKQRQNNTKNNKEMIH